MKKILVREKVNWLEGGEVYSPEELVAVAAKMKENNILHVYAISDWMENGEGREQYYAKFIFERLETDEELEKRKLVYEARKIQTRKETIESIQRTIKNLNILPDEIYLDEESEGF